MIEWRKVEGYEYEVSNTGHIRNIHTGKELANRGSRYSSVTLCSSAGQVQVTVHKLVAEYASVNEASRAIIGKASQISRCCNKVKGCNKHRGFEWSFKEACV